MFNKLRVRTIQLLSQRAVRPKWAHSLFYIIFRLLLTCRRASFAFIQILNLSFSLTGFFTQTANISESLETSKNSRVS